MKQNNIYGWSNNSFRVSLRYSSLWEFTLGKIRNNFPGNGKPRTDVRGLFMGRFVRSVGIEPTTLCLKGRCSTD